MAYRSLYEFNTSEAGALSFKEGDAFTPIDTKSDPHWLLVVDSVGLVGYVPSNYLIEDNVSL